LQGDSSTDSFVPNPYGQYWREYESRRGDEEEGGDLNVHFQMRIEIFLEEVLALGI
jgi:hypothetical protein